MKHPMPRNRRKLRRRAAAWRAWKESTYEAAAIRMVMGISQSELLKGRGNEPKGIYRV